MGAYGSGPTCFQRQLEFDNLVNAAANGALLAEAQHFVATLFETQASLDDPSLANYVQTSRYQALNPSPQTPDLGLDRFITDLYNAFLLRPPDDDGKNFWLQNNNGRKHLIIAFEVSIEFGDLVGKLYEDDTPPCCITRCPSGEAFNSATCSCEPVDPYFILVDSNLYFRKEQFTRTCKGDQSDAVWNRL